jgi:hypothetical protein
MNKNLYTKITNTAKNWSDLLAITILTPFDYLHYSSQVALLKACTTNFKSLFPHFLLPVFHEFQIIWSW